MKARLLRDMTCDPDFQFPDGIQPAGTVIEDPRVFRLVQMGVAAAADAECELKAARTPEQLARAQYAYERLSRGIHPDDYAAYDQGLMTGYQPDGSWIPGPNFIGPEED